MKAQSGVTFGHLVLTALEGNPDGLAFRTDDRSISYRQFGESVFSIARALDRLDVRRGQGIAMLASNKPEVFAVRCAAALLGLRYTPLNAMGAPKAQAQILSDAELSVIVTDAGLAEATERARRLSGADPKILCLGPGADGDLLALAGRERTAPLPPQASEDDIDLLAYTGGTTGRQKGVMLPHRSLVQNVFMTLGNWEAPSSPRMLLASPLSHSAGLLPLPVLLRGGTICLQRKFEPEAVLRMIEAERVDSTLLVPSMIYTLLDHSAFSDYDLSSLQNLIYIASPISPTRLAEGLERIGPVFSQWFGQTEAPNIVTQLRRRDHDPARPELLTSCGRPAAGVDVRLLDADGREAEAGEDGEICVRGALVMDGYWRNPEATEEALQGGWLRTGDMARKDEQGYLYIVDRKKDMIISGGFNIYSREVEDSLSAHPSVAQCAVIGVPHEKWGEAVKAFVVLRDGAEADLEGMIATVKAAKGSHFAPKSIELATSLPLTPVGKVDKQALRRPFWGDAGRRVN